MYYCGEQRKENKDKLNRKCTIVVNKEKNNKDKLNRKCTIVVNKEKNDKDKLNSIHLYLRM